MSPLSGGMEPQGFRGRWWGRIVLKMRHLIDAQIPEGYQDDFGFHFGRPSYVGERF